MQEARRLHAGYTGYTGYKGGVARWWPHDPVLKLQARALAGKLEVRGDRAQNGLRARRT